jgi:hypothetical protein
MNTILDVTVNMMRKTFCFVQNFFFGQHELEYLFFLSRKAWIFFPEFNIRLYDKNSESDFFFFLHHNHNSWKFVVFAISFWWRTQRWNVLQHYLTNIYLILHSILASHVAIRERPFNLKVRGEGVMFFSKKIFWFPMLLKKIFWFWSREKK